MTMKLGIAAAVVVAAGVVWLAADGRDAGAKPQSRESTAHRPRTRDEAAPVGARAASAAPSKARTGPTRFASAAERERFARALAQARAASPGRPRSRQTYDFGGERVPTSPPPALPPPPGRLDKSYIRDRIHEIVPLLAECYDLARVQSPRLAGTVVVDFTIDAEEEVGGYVSEASVDADSSLQDPALSECVTETILSLELVPPEGGGTVKVHYPLTFTPGSEGDEEGGSESPQSAP